MEYTAAGLEILQSRSKTLTVRERQIMVLATGSDASRRMLQTMGEEALHILIKLEDMGLIRPVRTPGASAPHAAPPSASEGRPEDQRSLLGRLFGSREATPTPSQAPAPIVTRPAVPVAEPVAERAARPVEKDTTPAVAPIVTREEAEPVAAAAQPARTRPAARRSIVAAKMYILDMLQLVRSMEASALAVDIQTSADENELVGHLLRGARHFAEATNPTYAAKVQERLSEVLPEEHLPRLASLQ